MNCNFIEKNLQASWNWFNFANEANNIITMISDKIEYIIMLIKLFAKHFGLSYMQAFRYISLHDGIEYAEKHYNILHTLSFEDQVAGLAAFCHKKGGLLI